MLSIFDILAIGSGTPSMMEEPTVTRRLFVDLYARATGSSEPVKPPVPT